jgi:integrase/recombinase XerD
MRAYIILFTYQKESLQGYPIKVLVRDGNKTRSYNTRMFSSVKDWNAQKTEVYKTHRRHILYNQELTRLNDKIASGLLKAKVESWNIDQLYNHIAGQTIGAISFFEFAAIRIAEEKNKGKVGNASAYEMDVTKLQNFCGGNYSFKQIDYNFLTSFKNHFLAAGNSPNTIHRNLRTYRAIFNEAINRQIITKAVYPFTRGLMPTLVRTAKRNFSRKDLIKLRDAELTKGKAFARDLYMLMFYFAGMDYVDITQYKFFAADKYITYQRHKLGGTGQTIKIKILEPAHTILKSYNYKLPVVPVTAPQYTSYKNARNRVNKNLAAIGSQLGLPIKPTTKTARHTFATLAKKQYVNPELLKDLMGHEGHEVSDIYKDRHSQKKLNKALALIVTGKKKAPKKEL